MRPRVFPGPHDGRRSGSARELNHGRGYLNGDMQGRRLQPHLHDVRERMHGGHPVAEHPEQKINHRRNIHAPQIRNDKPGNSERRVPQRSGQRKRMRINRIN